VKAFSLRTENRLGCPFLLLLVTTVEEILARSIRKEKQNKRDSNWKGRSKAISFADTKTTNYLGEGRN
jgi:hypothetical protein